MRVDGETPAFDPEFKQVDVVSGRFPLFEQQDVTEGENERERSDNRAEEPMHVKGAEEHQHNADGPGGGCDDGDEQISIQSPNGTGRVVGGIGIGESEVSHRSKL